MNYNYKIAAFADEAGKDLDVQIAEMKKNGVSMLELRSVWGLNVTELSNEQAKQIRNELEANGLSVWSMGSPCGKDPISDPFGPQLDKLKRTVELAQICGANRIRMFSFFGCEDAVATRDEVMERLTRFCEAAEGSGVKLCHENEKGIFGDIASRCNDILRSVPALGGVFDPANFLQCGQPTLEAWELLKDRIDYFHVKDVMADGTLVPAGYGEGHLPELVKDFLARGGEVMTLEPHLRVFDALASLENEGAKSQVANTYATAAEAFAASADGLKKILASL